MVAISAAAHAAFIVAIFLMPSNVRTETDPKDVMVISLGGAPGPRAGGMTPMGGRPVQQVEPEPPKRPEAVRPPAAKPPEMTMPTEREKPKPPPPKPPPIKQTTDEARGRTPTKGPQEEKGTAIAQTGARGMGIGLSTGGGGTGGEIDFKDFCCVEWLNFVLGQINSNWKQQQGVTAVTSMRFTIRRDGTVTDVNVSRSSGFAALDLAAQRAVLLARVPPIPPEYTNEQLTLNLHFEYSR